MSKGVYEEFPARAVFPTADLVDIDVVVDGGGVAVVDLRFHFWLSGIFFDWVLGGVGVGVYFDSAFPGS